MADLDLPSGFLGMISSAQFGLEANTQVFESPLSKFTQRSELDGARWKFTFTTVPMRRAEIAPLQAVLLRLKGRVNRLRVYDLDATALLGTGLGTPIVKGAGQTGNSLITDGWTPNQTNALKPGDYFTAGGEFKMVTQTVAADSGGEATIYFEPPFRASPADNSAITISGPKCLMILENPMVEWGADKSGIYQPMTISLVEAFS